jgi:hypothetical protein
MIIVAASFSPFATAALAQSNAPVPGTGDSTRISSGNRDTNAAYNQLIGAASGAKSSNSDVKVQPPHSAGPATAADIKAGSNLRDSQGVQIGTIDSLQSDGVVVNTGQAKIKVPLLAFGKDEHGLLLAITAAHFNELIAKAHSAP